MSNPKNKKPKNITTTLKKIFSRDYKPEGAEVGFEQGKAGETRNTFSVLKRINPLNYVYGFNEAFDSAVEGQNEMHQKGMEKTFGIYTPNIPAASGALGQSIAATSQTGRTMDTMDNTYDVQLNLLGAFDQQLDMLKAQLAIVPDEYEAHIREAEALGFVQDYVDGMNHRSRDFKSRIEQILGMLEIQQAQIATQREVLLALRNQAQE